MQRYICKIHKKKRKGSGFFCYIPLGNSKLLVLITNEHVIDKDYFKKNSNLTFILNDDKDTKIIQIGNNRKKYSSNKYDTTIIEIFPSIDKVKNFLELEDNILTQNSETFFKKYHFYNTLSKKSKSLCIIWHFKRY